MVGEERHRSAGGGLVAPLALRRTFERAFPSLGGELGARTPSDRHRNGKIEIGARVERVAQSLRGPHFDRDRRAQDPRLPVTKRKIARFRSLSLEMKLRAACGAHDVSQAK